MKLQDLQVAEKKLLLQTYERNPILFVSGQGAHLRDEDGNDYLVQEVSDPTQDYRKLYVGKFLKKNRKGER